MRESRCPGNLGGTRSGSSLSPPPPPGRSRLSARRYRIIEPRLGRSSNMASLEPGLSGDEMNDADEVDRIAARNWCCCVVRGVSAMRPSMSSSQSGRGTVLCDDDGVVNGFMVMRKKRKKKTNKPCETIINQWHIIGMYTTLPGVDPSLGPGNAGKYGNGIG